MKAVWCERERTNEGYWVGGRQQQGQQGQQLSPIQLHNDNFSTLSPINNNVVSGRSKHIDVNYHVAREQAKLGTVKFVYVPTSEQLADIQTKALSIIKFSGFRKNIGMI